MAMITLLASPLIQVVIEKVADGLSGELRLLRGVLGDMERLQSILSTIKDVLDDAENKAIGEKALCSWLKKLKDATYDADDVVDTFCTEALRQQIEYHDHFKRQLVRDFFSSQNPIIFRRGIARKLKHVLGRLDDIAAERVKFHLTHGSVSVRHVQPVETYSAVHELEILGRDEDKEKIVHFLINEETDKDLAVLAVVGLGGIGKTALAQLVYNDDRVTGQFFDLRIWICVSGVFDVKEIARKIIQCVKNEPYHNLELESLSNLVRDTLSGKRFFLVLDDVWNEEPAKWESLQTLLRFGRSGSKIVTTTRNEVVANVMGSVSRYRLKGLSADDCWTLFSQRAFLFVKETANLTKIGKEIVGKCGGLPLAAKALGSLMSSKSQEFEWLAIRDSEIWQLTNENEIVPALKLSYYHLPSHLKNCFVYCSLFPKDYKFHKNELIRLWIGEGFIPPSMNENISPEDAGNQCFNSLLWRSFFQDVEKNSNEFITCKMHDLVHDLACGVAKDEFHFTKYQKETKINDSCRYLSLLVDDKSPNIVDVFFETKKLRSLILIGSCGRIGDVNPNMFVRVRNLRVLDLGGCNISVFPSTICILKHLRFLDLSYAGMKVLPSSIGCLYNLQTLILRHCYNLTNLPNTITNLHNLHTLDVAFCSQLVELPRDIRKMKNLRHLDNRGCYKLSGMPMGMGQLTNLETLPVFIVGEEEEEGQHITELQQLNQIRGFLCINNLQKVTNPIEARDANLGAKTRVKSLCLEWGDERRDAAADVAVEEEVIASLVPPPNLEWLKLRNYLGINYPNWMVMSSCNSLETILLVGLRRCAYLPPLGQLPSLKILKISGMDAIRRIGEELYGEARGDKVPFHKLEELYLIRMKNLEEWVVEAAAGAGAGPGDIRRRRDMVMFPCLTKFEIFDCPKLKRVHPSFPVSVVDLSISIKGEVVLAAGSLSGMNRVRNLRVTSSSSSSSSFWEGLQYLTALEKLTTCLPEGLIHLHIPTLRTLEIITFNGEALTTSLAIAAAGLQQQPQQPPLLFTSLHSLHINCCYLLTVLPEWVGALTSLQGLKLSSCPKLEMLPDGLQHLTALQQLTIKYCPILEKRCEREIGEDWHKIKHIPHIQINPSS